MAAFNVVQFEEKDGSSVAIVHREWLTPRKTEVFWPPHKRSASFYKCLRDGETVQSDWKLYKIKKIFYSCGTFVCRKLMAVFTDKFKYCLAQAQLTIHDNDY
uniref:Uncharacterized protein n=1 Tax=Photinus pyralis TaxID=7054 RepID=A0A1Y1K2F3_PHOPY